VPLRLRLALLFAAGTGLLIAVVGLAFLLQLTRSLDASLDTALRTRADLLASRASSTGTAGGTDPFATVSGSEQVAQILTSDGAVLRSSDAAGPATLLDAGQRRTALAGEVSFTAQANGDRSRLLAAPFDAQGRRLLAVVGTGTDITDAAEDRVRTAILIGGPPAVLGAGVAAWLLAGAALRPVERMRRQVADITEHDHDAQLAVPATRDEIARLAVTMNDLLTRLQHALERERGFVADAGHELRTPLAILRAELELAARPGRSRHELAAAVSSAAEEADRLNRLAEDLLLLARADAGQQFLRRCSVDIDDLLRAAARMAVARGAEDGITVQIGGTRGLVLMAEPDRLRRAIDNLLDNAVRHSPPGATVTLSSTREVQDGAPVVVIEVVDTGPGFPPEFLPVAFERFRRADDARTRHDGGSGLGLAIVRSIAIGHGGRAVAANRGKTGVSVRLELPEGAASDPDVAARVPSRT